MKTLIIITLVILGLIGAVAVALSGSRKGKGKAGNYRQRKLMTENEKEFFGRLIAAFPEHYVFPQVAMTALLEASSSNAKTAHSDRLKIAQQRIDFVVSNKECQVVAVVELDDKTHSRVKDQLRDSRLEQGGIRTVRFQSKNKPTVEALRAAVLSDEIPEIITIERLLSGNALVP